jgi:threonyl-tRNA synthetase
MILSNFDGGAPIIRLLLPDGTEKETELSELRKNLQSLNALAVRVNGELKDVSVSERLPEGALVEAVAFDSREGKEVFWHSTSHIMAHAVKDLFPDVKVTIGPAIEEGFYYDFDKPAPFTPDDLEKIEKRMKEIIKSKSRFSARFLPKQDAINLFKEKGEDYKVQLLQEISDESVSLYDEGGFTDLCRGPHIPDASKIKAFKLLSVAGAYWRGDERNKMLQRIYGISFDNKEDLDKYIHFLEEVKKRDHRKLGKELGLFSTSDEIGSGLILWHPNGAIVRKIIEDFWRNEHLKADYKILYTPHIARLNLWQKSGHLEFYSENMYSPMDIDGIAYELKPMNCPFHINIYQSELRSYRDFPIRYAELGTVYRYERSGVLHGLLRVRGFTQDDAHIFCREDQIEDEILNILDFTLFILRTFGFDKYDIYLSTRPEKYVGSPENWEKSTNALKRALELKELRYEVDPGEGVFYGPKIDIKIKDSLNRSWQCSTIQVDFNNPERFDLVYRGSDGKDHRPIMIHRALMGSLERFFGVLIEHYSGAFPVWLAPVQAVIMTIAERHDDYAAGVYKRFREADIRCAIDLRNEKIGYKIREATLQKVPYLILVGDKETVSNTITVRKRNGDNMGSLAVDDFIMLIKGHVNTRQ